MRAGGLLLAAGRSLRMGGEDKLAKLWRGRPLLAYALDALAGAPVAARVIVARAPLAPAPAFAHRPILNPRPEAGLASSLALGLGALQEMDAALVLLGDMPGVDAALCQRLIAAWRPGAYGLVPTRGGRWGNPAILSTAAMKDAATLTGDRGARALLEARAREVIAVEVETDAIFQDFDRPEDFT